MRTLIILLVACYGMVASLPAAAGAPGRWLELLTLISANPSREAALTEQESSWNQFAESPFGGLGLRQILRTTGDWLAVTICRDLGPFDPFDPAWSLKCGVRYAEHLQKNNHFGNACTNRRVAEQEYNGGAWVIWELKKARSGRLKDAEAVCGTKLLNGRKRSRRSCMENYSYPKHIDRRQRKYAAMGGLLCK